MIRVRLNDNIAVDVNTNDPQAAAAAGRRWFQQNHPQEFDAWRQTQLGIGSSISRGASAGVDQFQSTLFSAAEGLGRAVGSTGLEEFGRTGRERNQAEAEAAFPSELRQPFTEVTGPSEAARATAEAVTGSLPATGTGIAGALAGARAGAPFGFRGRLVGGLAGGAAAAFPQLFGSNIERQIQESGDIVSPGAAAAGAAVQAPLEAATDVLTLGASRFLRRPAAEAAQAAGAGLGRRLATGAAVGAAAEAPVEVAQTAIERAQAGLPVFTTEGGAGREYLEAGLGGAAAGGVTGAAIRGAFGQRPAGAEAAAVPEGAFAPTAAPATPVTPEAAAPPRMAPLTIPERPEAFATREEAEAFIAENPRFTPPTTLATPEATIGFVNAARVSDWQQSVLSTRRQAIDEFFPRAPDTNQPIVSDAISNLAEAANRGDLNLNEFSPNAVAKAALASRDIDPARVTRAEVKAAADQLDALAQTGVIKKESPTKYAVNYGAPTPSQPAPTPAPTPEAAPATGAVPPTPEGAPIPEAAPAPPAQEAAYAEWEARRDAAGDAALTPQERNLLITEANRDAGSPLPGVAQVREKRAAASRAWEATNPAPVAPPATAAAPARPVTPAQAPAPSPAQQAQTTEQLADAAAEADPASGAGDPTDTVEEAIFSTPRNESIKKQQQTLDKQIADGFRGGFFGKWFASPIASFAKQPIYRDSADQMDRLYVRNHAALNEVTQLFEPALTLPAASQGRIALALQEARSRRQLPNRDAFTAEENAAMDGLLQAGQRMLDYYIDAYTSKFFNPANATTAQERARLEAFQQAKGDRLITEMSDAEIRAASQDGAREVRRLNSRRDPFFFPQISQGTHFAAAYQRQPGGKEKLVRIYFFDPVRGVRAARQKLGVQRDPEAAAIRALREEFPDTSRFRVMQRGVEVENDGRAADLRRDGDFIAQYLQELSKVSGKEAKQIIARMSKEIDKAQMDRIFRPNNDLLRAVTPENATDYIRDVLPAYFIAASKVQARRLIQDDFNRSLDGYSNEEKQYWNDLLNYSTTPTEAFGTGRALAFFMFLGFNVSTAVIQMTQNPTVLVPRLLRDGGGAASFRYFGSAAKDVYGTLDALRVFGKELEQTKRLVQRGVLKPDEVSAIQRALREGRLNPVQAVELRSTVSAADLRNSGIADRDATTFAGGFNKVLDLSGRMLATVDETNRATAFLAAYRLAKARPEVMARAGRLDNRTYNNAYEYAEAVTGDTNFRSTKEDRALIQRFHPVAEMMTQFMSPVFKLMELYARSAKQTVEGLRKGDPTMARAAALQFAAMTAAQVALAGVWSLPLAERLRDLTEAVLKLAFGDIVDYEQELEKLLGNNFLASAMSYGLPHAWGSISLNSRLKIDPLPQGSVTEWDVLSALGPVGGLIQKGMDAYQAWQLGDYWGLSYAMLPTAFANVAKGAQLAIDEEQFTKRQGRIITPEQVRAAGESGILPPAAQQAIGFAPPEFADIRRTANRARELQTATRDATERVNIELARIALRAMEAQAAGRQAEAQALTQQYRQRINEIRAEQRDKPPEFQVQVNESAIMQRARQDFLGRGSPEVLVPATRTQARPAVQEMIERSQWRNQQ
jgi:ribosomal protein S20